MNLDAFDSIEKLGQIEWDLRYNEDANLVRFQAASILAQYRAILECTAKQRQEVLKYLKSGEGRK